MLSHAILEMEQRQEVKNMSSDLLALLFKGAHPIKEEKGQLRALGTAILGGGGLGTTVPPHSVFSAFTQRPASKVCAAKCPGLGSSQRVTLKNLD